MAQRLIVRPLREISELFKQIAAGDLTNRITDHGRNAAARLLPALWKP